MTGYVGPELPGDREAVHMCEAGDGCISDYDDARATFCDDIALAVCQAVQAGVSADDIRADFEAVLSIQAVES